MNRLTKREREIAEYIAWGAAYKETADALKIAIRTVDNTIRKVKQKLNLNKNTEVAAWWFCTNYGISYDLSPLARKRIAGVLLLFCLLEIPVTGSFNNKRRYRMQLRTNNLVYKRNTATERTILFNPIAA